MPLNKDKLAKLQAANEQVRTGGKVSAFLTLFFRFVPRTSCDNSFMLLLIGYCQKKEEGCSQNNY